LQIALALLTSLGTGMLALAQQDPRLALFAVTAAAASVYFTDRHGWLVLKTTSANIAGLVALALTLWDWQHMERDLLFLALANSLVYLQCILHFRVKTPRIYSMLMLLSFLQVAVASVLTDSPLFGCLLAAYTFLALGTLASYSIYREAAELCGADAPEAGERALLVDFLLTPLHQLVRRKKSEDGAPRPAPPRWPLRDVPSGFHFRRPREKDQSGWLGSYPIRFGILILLTGPVVFLLVPRPIPETGEWGSVPRGTTALMGFSENITLREIWRISDNPDEVMRVSFSSFENGTVGGAYPLQEEPWLRGLALGSYSAGNWRRQQLDRPGRTSLKEPPEGLGQDLVLQEITLEPMRDSNALFAVEPTFALREKEKREVEINRITEQLYRPEAWRRKTFTYQLLTNGFQDGWQAPFRVDRRKYDPDFATGVADDWRAQRDMLLEPFREGSVQRETRQALTGVKQLTDALVSERRLDARRNPRATAAALEEYLRDGGRFEYTLASPPREPPTIDPVENFVVNTRRGHCELFASALALMLRSQGIPSRVVVGYKGGEWNAVAGYYVIRQLHAHAWVEAWIIENGEPAGWLRLDPTPGSRLSSDSHVAAVWQITNYLQYLWSRYVLRMNAQTQQETFVAPLAALFEKRTWQDLLREAEAILNGEDWSAERWISWRAGLAAVILQLALVAIVVGVRRAVRRLRAGKPSVDRAARTALEIAFYARLERLLEEMGLRRQVGQTPREFAAAAAARLAAEPHLSSLAPLPPFVVEAYYSLRYGEQVLDEWILADIEQALARLSSSAADSETA
jgi:hypothetical protein